ncbi:hypothetical protein RF11_00538 [Thelohanellus kitauei]|uniref:Uncharacterized protein n=1 Tax=Thelohanellus kitauei TaxID=669202 RepID=A0A0C2MGK4_THEKT|nr:hypothetical protein RF11_00538 [Thelohanellus kitauei]
MNGGAWSKSELVVCIASLMRKFIWTYTRAYKGYKVLMLCSCSKRKHSAFNVSELDYAYKVPTTTQEHVDTPRALQQYPHDVLDIGSWFAFNQHAIIECSIS